MSTQRREDASNITAVILDYGQVLVRCPTRSEFGRMADMFNVSFETFYHLWEASRDSYDRGDLTPQQYWLKLAEQTNTAINSEQIETLRQVEIEIWCHTYPDMLDWLKHLHAAGFKTALLSNMPLDLVQYVQANCQWMENFAFKTFSAEVRLVKPDPAIYEHTLRGLGVAAADALFVDDRETNIQAARAQGIRALQFRSIAELRKDLESVGFPILPEITEPASTLSDAVPADSAKRAGEEIKLQL